MRRMFRDASYEEVRPVYNDARFDYLDAPIAKSNKEVTPDFIKELNGKMYDLEVLSANLKEDFKEFRGPQVVEYAKMMVDLNECIKEVRRVHTRIINAKEVDESEARELKYNMDELIKAYRDFTRIILRG